MTKTISLLGATGSIGRQTLDVARELGLSVAALTANRQVDLLEQQARQFRPRLAVLYDPAAAKELELDPGECIALEDSPNGIRSAHAAGCKPIMIPDLSQPDEETKKLLYACCDDLSKVIDVIQKLV